MLERRVKAFVVAAVLAAPGAAARAQNGAPPHRGESNQGIGEEPAPALAPEKEDQFFDPEMEVKRYDNILGLDDGQRAKVLKIFRDKLATFKSNAVKRREIGEKTRKLHEQIMKLRGELDKAVREQTLVEKRSFEQMRAVLRPDQMERFSAIEAQLDQGPPKDGAPPAGAPGPEPSGPK